MIFVLRVQKYSAMTWHYPRLRKVHAQRAYGRQENRALSGRRKRLL